MAKTTLLLLLHLISLTIYISEEAMADDASGDTGDSSITAADQMNYDTCKDYCDNSMPTTCHGHPPVKMEYYFSCETTDGHDDIGKLDTLDVADKIDQCHRTCYDAFVRYSCPPGQQMIFLPTAYCQN